MLIFSVLFSFFICAGEVSAEAALKMLSQGSGPSASRPGSKPPPRWNGRWVEVEVFPKE